MYDWKRFWSWRDAQINLGDEGYLVDPESEYGTLLNPDVSPVDFLSSVPCLVLLGEPGIGKSFTLATAREVVRQRVTAAGDMVLWIDLHEVGSDQQLNRKLFDAPRFQRWRDGSGRLYLFLDSFDECRVQVNTLPALLLSELSDCDASRLSLRIACRTADWPASLEGGLQQMFGTDRVEVLELLPLRKVDVRFASQQAGVADTDAFLAAVARSDVVPLAIKPTSLALLINKFRRDGFLPNRQVVLYRDGCRLLCEETERRLEVGLQPSLSAQRRIAVAGRIAALTVFGNRAAVWTAVDLGDVPEDDVTIAVLGGDVEYDDGSAFAVDATAVRDTLNTGLFSSRGSNRLGWAHRTFAEFLAADYLIRRDLALPQIISLIVHADDPEGKIVPQLHETAAWLASLRPDVFNEIMQRDPEVLLRSDVASATNEDRKALVEVLLRGYDEGTLLDDDRGLRLRYARLNHPMLADQLRPFIIDRDKGLVVRRVAVDMAEQCHLATLLDDLIAVALDPAEPQHVRVNAAYAVIRIDDPVGRARLKPLVSIDPKDDPDDELKGCGLRATWPDVLTGSELFAVLTPVRGHLMGAYWSYLNNDPMSLLKAADLPIALQWARQQVDSQQVPNDFQPLVNGIMRKAWDHLDAPGVIEEFAPMALTRLRQMEGLFHQDGTNQAEDRLAERDTRYRVVEAAIILAEDLHDLRLLAWNKLIRPEDMGWILGRLAAVEESQKLRWAELVAAALDLQNRDVVELVLCAREEHEVLRQVLAPWFDAIPLDSVRAQRAREMYEQELKWGERKNSQPESLEPPPAERVLADLEQFISGDLDAWWRLNYNLILENQAAQSANEFESDLTSLPGWKAADDATKVAIVAAAEPYLAQQSPRPEDWVSKYPTITIFRPDWAAFRAFRLLLSEAPDRLTTMPDDVWAKWAEVVLAFPTLSDEEAVEAQRQLVREAYGRNPEGVTSTLLLLLDREDQEGHGYVDYLLRRIDGCWDGPLGGVLLNHLHEKRFSPRILKYLLEALVARNVDGAQDYADEVIALRGEDSERERATAAAAVLMQHPTNGGWEICWPAMMEDGEFGEAVLDWIVHNDWHGSQIAAQLTEDQLVEAYVWLSGRYPHSEDPWPDGAVTFRHAVADWRDDLLRTLQHRGTPESCAAIQRTIDALSHLEWLKWTLQEAKRITRQRTWEPTTIADIRSLAQSRERRLVQSAAELQDVVLESLGRFQEKLQINEPPLAPYLWDERTKEPKDEERLSDLLKIHLDEDLRDRGIISNREVVNRRGEETDIRVEAVKHDAAGGVADILTVVIEVKGNWNQQLHSAMEAQLVDRYMASNRSDHGIYVIGWYTWGEWNPNDWRHQRAPKYDLAEARRLFDEQATNLTDQNRTVRAVVLDTGLR